MSLVPHLFGSLVEFAEGEDAMFYGYDRVRFPTAVLVGSQVRLTATVADVVEIGGGEQLRVDLVIEAEGVERPACVAQAVFRHYAVKAPD